MDPIRGSSAYNMQSISSANPAQAATGAHPSGHADSLTLAMLSDHTVAALNAKETQGNAQEKMLAGFTKQALGSGQLQLSPNQTPGCVAQFGTRRNQDVLAIKAKLNEHDQSKYDVLSVGFRRCSEEPLSMRLPTPMPRPQKKIIKFPPQHSLLGLPTELQQAIMGHVFTGSTKRQGVYDLRSLDNSTRLLKAVLAGDSLLKFKHDLQKKIIGAINKLSVGDLLPFADSGLFALASDAKKEACLAAAVEDLDENSIASLGAALEELKPAQRSRLVNAILNAGIDNDGDTDMEVGPTAVGNMIGSLSSGMHTITAHHAKIIDSIMKLPESGKCYAIGGLGKALHRIDTRSRDLIVQAALDMEDEEFKGGAIGGLAQGMSALTDQQRNAIFNSALQFENESEFSNSVMPGLTEGFNALTPAQQFSLANTVSQMTDDDEQARSIRRLGAALEEINGRHHIDILEILSNSILSMHSENSKANALGYLGPGLNHDKGLKGSYAAKHEQLVTNIFNAVMEIPHETHKSRAIAGLGGGLSAFSIEQRSSLVEACVNMRSEKNKSISISGLGAGLRALTHEQREKLINVSIIMVTDESKANAIAGLGNTLKAFTAEQQAKLVDSAVNMGIRFKGRVIASLRNVSNIQQLGRLIDAAVSLPLTNANAGLLSPQAQALASLTETELL
jgi:hypothetical protein